MSAREGTPRMFSINDLLHVCTQDRREVLLAYTAGWSSRQLAWLITKRSVVRVHLLQRKQACPGNGLKPVRVTQYLSYFSNSVRFNLS